MALNLLCGSAKVRDKRRPILWTGDNAKHLAERHSQDLDRHPYLHVQAQQTLAHSTLFKAKNGGWSGLLEKEKGTFCIPVILHTNLVEIKSCFLLKSMTMTKARIQKGIGVPPADRQEFVKGSVDELKEFGGFSDTQEAVEFVNQSLASVRRQRQSKSVKTTALSR